MELGGYVAYLAFFLTTAGIYALLCLGLNIQWGYTGLFNIGVSAFFAIGAYGSAILTKTADATHLGGFGLPFLAGVAGAAVLAGILGYLIGIPIMRLKEDYQAIATIGIAETIRLIIRNNPGHLTNGTRGIRAIPQPLHDYIPFDYNFFYLLIVAAAIVLIYLVIEKAIRAPWGRALKAIREDETVAQVVGKDVTSFKMQSFVLGSIIMGVSGALYAHFIQFISPEAFEPMNTTFLVWVMLIAGGSGNNRGAILGAFVLWFAWTQTEFLTDMLPVALQNQAGAIRVILIGLILEVILLTRPRGLLGEEKHISSYVRRRAEE